MFGAALAALGSFFTPVISTVATVGSGIISGIGSAASAIGSGLSSAYGAASNYITGLAGSGAGTGINAGDVARSAASNLTGSTGGQLANTVVKEKDKETPGMFDKLGNYMNNNPGATMAIGGAAKGLLDYMGKEKELDFQREQLHYQKPWNASSGSDNYASHYQSLTKGLLHS